MLLLTTRAANSLPIVSEVSKVDNFLDFLGEDIFEMSSSKQPEKIGSGALDPTQAEELRRAVTDAVAATYDAGSLSEAENKRILSAIGRLFPSATVQDVRIALIVYFIKNDPSPKSKWASMSPLVVGGVQKPITDVVGNIISVSDGDGTLRKFLHSMEEDVPMVVEFSPELQRLLQARLASVGQSGVSPVAGVSWVRGTTSRTSHFAAQRASFARSKLVDQSSVVVPEGPVSGAEHNSAPSAESKPSRTFY